MTYLTLPRHKVTQIIKNSQDKYPFLNSGFLQILIFLVDAAMDLETGVWGSNSNTPFFLKNSTKKKKKNIKKKEKERDEKEDEKRV